MRTAATVLVSSIAVGCLGCDPSTQGPGEAGPVSIVVQRRGDQVRLVAVTGPLECETADIPRLADRECDSSTLEIFLPADRLQVGPLLLTDDIRMQVIHGGSSTCLSTIATNDPNQKVVFEEIVADAVTVRLTGFAQHGLRDGAYVAPRCTLEEAPLEIPTGQFVLVPFDLPKLVGSSERSTCEVQPEVSDDCDTWTVELSVPASLLAPGTVGDFDVDASISANPWGGGLDDCAISMFGGPVPISIERVTEEEIEFVLPIFDFGTSTPVAGRYVAPICR